MDVRSYRDLSVWQLGTRAAVEVYRLTRKFPKEDLYGLTQQIRRAAISIPSNIAEGNELKSSKGYLKHISIALGSRAEVETQLYIAIKLGYCTADEAEELNNMLQASGRMLQGLYASIKRRLKQE
jgi:four helix bundle protein